MIIIYIKYLIVEIIRVMIFFLNCSDCSGFFLFFSDVSMILIIMKIRVNMFKIMVVVVDYLWNMIILNSDVVISCILVEIGMVFEILI